MSIGGQLVEVVVEVKITVVMAVVIDILLIPQ